MKYCTATICYPTRSATLPMHLRTVEGAKEWLGTQPIDTKLRENIVAWLAAQMKDDAFLFPNVIVFVDANGKPITMEEVVPKCKRCDKWCSRTCYQTNDNQ